MIVFVNQYGCTENLMVTAIVLTKAETSRILDLANQIAEAPGVSEVFSVAGRYDLADVITDKMRHLDGIVETETMIAFRAYSKQALEAGFELGLDQKQETTWDSGIHR